MNQLDLLEVTANAYPGLPRWLAALKLAAKSRFEEMGFPSREDEEWRFTDIRPIASTNFVQPEKSSFNKESLIAYALEDTTQIVIVDGVVSAELSHNLSVIKGVKIDTLSSFSNNDNPVVPIGRYAGFEKNVFAAQNTANFEDCLLIQIQRNSIVEKPLHLLYLSTSSGEPTASYPRTLVVCGEGSQATFIETWGQNGDGITLSNAVTEFELAENSIINHYKVNETGAESYHISTTQIQQAGKSVFNSNSFTFNGKIVRNDINAVHSGEGISTTLNGLSLAEGSRLIDNHTSIDHATPNCESHELYKYILNDKSRGVFNGKIFVREDAQKTDAKQTNKTLLLSDDAQIDTKPQLEIYADDVKCTHGATIGQLDDKQIFYLRSRGISLEDARSLLVYAFAGDLISRVKVEALRDRLDTHLLSKLPQK